MRRRDQMPVAAPRITPVDPDLDLRHSKVVVPIHAPIVLP